MEQLKERKIQKVLFRRTSENLLLIHNYDKKSEKVLYSEVVHEHKILTNRNVEVVCVYVRVVCVCVCVCMCVCVRECVYTLVDLLSFINGSLTNADD